MYVYHRGFSDAFVLAKQEETFSSHEHRKWEAEQQWAQS